MVVKLSCRSIRNAVEVGEDLKALSQVILTCYGQVKEDQLIVLPSCLILFPPSLGQG